MNNVMIQINKYPEVYGPGESDKLVEQRTHEILQMTMLKQPKNFAETSMLSMKISRIFFP